MKRDPMRSDPTIPTLETPIAEYGLVEVSRPIAAALLGFSLKSLNRRIRDGQIAANGRVKKTVAVAEIEELRGRPITAHEYLLTMANKSNKDNSISRRKGQPEGVFDDQSTSV